MFSSSQLSQDCQSSLLVSLRCMIAVADGGVWCRQVMYGVFFTLCSDVEGLLVSVAENGGADGDDCDFGDGNCEDAIVMNRNREKCRNKKGLENRRD